MLATLADAPLRDPRLVYEAKYDGIRALAEVELAAGPRGEPRIHLSSRTGNDKTSQFPEIVAALASWARARPRTHGRQFVVFDGEIVALDEAGAALGFQRLQDRIHLTNEDDVLRLASQRPVAYVVFDLLWDGTEDWRGRPLVERRMRLEQILAGDVPDLLRPSQIAIGDGTALYEQAMANGWEGLIVKDGASRYRSGERSADWRKIKLVKRQELIIGGWTEPRHSRAKLGALLLGQREEGGLRYVGHVGSGFSERDLQWIAALLTVREVADCPFTSRPPANERPHWVRPDLVAEVQFSGWTDSGIVRHAVFLGLRDDVPAAAIVRKEPAVGQTARALSTGGAKPKPTARTRLEKVTQQLEAIESSATGGGRVELPGGIAVDVTHLGKPLWPALGITKGELMRYYVAVAPYILPVVEDRPLVMRRFPDGIERSAFYQQRAPDEAPPGIRAEAVAADKEVPTRLIGGSLATLIYMTQLASISQDPWFSRVASIDDMDFAAIDLDPTEGTPFSRVLEVARWVHDELLELGVTGFPKSSGASGLHVYIPLPAKTPYESGLLFCQIVATLVARKHPAAATVERSVQRRPRASVYIDYLQNIRGKTIACAYSARASAFAGASTPVTWKEIEEGLDPRELTLRTLPSRLHTVGDLWAKLRRSKGIDLRGAIDRAHAARGKRPR